MVSLNVLALRYVSRQRVDGNRRLVQDRGKLMGTAIGGLQTIETLKATGGESDFFARWAGYQAKVVNGRQELEQYTQVLDAVPPLLTAVNTALILGIGGLRVMDGALTVGMLVAFQILMASFIAPVNRLVSLGGRLQMVEGDMNRLDDVLRYPIDPATGERCWRRRARRRSRQARRAPGAARRHLRLQPARSAADRGLQPHPGTRARGSRWSAARGAASPRSPGWSPASTSPGPARSCSTASRAPQIPRAGDDQLGGRGRPGRLPVRGHVRENLTLWDSTIPLPEVIAAARDACIHEDIAARPGGYDSPVDEGGANFSGGQRQRLEIARALVGQPTLLVLDEATSALDPITESLIDENLRRRGCTCLIVAHRLSTIRDADEIIVLEQGKVVQRGTHDELKALEGPYARLISAE